MSDRAGAHAKKKTEKRKKKTHVQKKEERKKEDGGLRDSLVVSVPKEMQCGLDDDLERQCTLGRVVLALRQWFGCKLVEVNHTPNDVRALGQKLAVWWGAMAVSWLGESGRKEEEGNGRNARTKKGKCQFRVCVCV